VKITIGSVMRFSSRTIAAIFVVPGGAVRGGSQGAGSRLSRASSASEAGRPGGCVVTRVEFAVGIGQRQIELVDFPSGSAERASRRSTVFERSGGKRQQRSTASTDVRPPAFGANSPVRQPEQRVHAGPAALGRTSSRCTRRPAPSHRPVRLKTKRTACAPVWQSVKA
jgi:hypothetical protein